MLKALGVAVAAAALMAGTAAAQIARLEIHPIVSSTIADTDLLGAGKGGQPVTIAGELRIPKPGNDKLPAVILLHGSGGIGGTQSPSDEWANALNALGIATLTIDSFSGRNIVSTMADQTQLGRLNMVVDAYRALAVLAKHSRIDASRIAVMGFSRGGQSALYSSMSRLRNAAMPDSDLRFAAHIAFYPDCITTYKNDTDVTGSPIRIFHGIADDYNPIAPCREYVKRLKAFSKDAEIAEYPDASHVLDSPAVRKPITASAASSVRNCHLAEGDDNQIINHQTKKPFTYGDACVVKGPTVAFNEAAYNQSHASMREFVTVLFRLK